MDIKEIGEFGLIERIKKMLSRPPAEVFVGIDDDAAAYAVSADTLQLITTDILVEHVHFNMEYITFSQLGWRSLAANLSDIAAMAGTPQYAVVSIAIPEKIKVESIEELYGGMQELADLFSVSVIGGDTTRSRSGLVVNIAVMGSVDKQKIALRSAAMPGDAIFVTGALGGSMAGLQVLSKNKAGLKADAVIRKHLTPMPRVKEAEFLSHHIDIHAMIDVSDGLASEVGHICKCSGVGVEIEEVLIPIDDETRVVAAKFDDDALEYALSGGEDFELVFTADEKAVNAVKVKFEEQFSIQLSKIGTVTPAERGIVLCTKQNRIKQLNESGWNHFSQ